LEFSDTPSNTRQSQTEKIKQPGCDKSIFEQKKNQQRLPGYTNLERRLNQQMKEGRP